MGHRLSKSNVSSSNSINGTAAATSTSTIAGDCRHSSNDITKIRNEENLNLNHPAGSSATINIKSSTSSTTSNNNSNQNLHIESTTVTVPAQAAASRFVIKIQLTKMEPGSSPDDTTRIISSSSGTSGIATVATGGTTTTTISTSVTPDGNSRDNLENTLNVVGPILNLTFTKNIQCDSNNQIVIESNEEIMLNNLNTVSDRRINGSSLNNNFISNFSSIQLIDEDGNELASYKTNNTNNNNTGSSIGQQDEAILRRLIPCGSENGNYNEDTHHNVPDINQKEMNGSCKDSMSTTICSEMGDKNHCCRRKKSTSYPSKWRCYKCDCRSSLNSNSNNNNNNTIDSNRPDDSNCSCNGSTTTATNTSSKSSTKSNWTSRFNCAKGDNTTNNDPSSSDMAMWVPPENPAFLSIPQTTTNRHLLPQFTRCPEVLLVTLPCPDVIGLRSIEDCDERARRLRAIEIETGVDPLTEIGSAFANILSSQKHWPHILCSPTFGRVVHSQVDYIHCLVPDLDKITNSSFYWGKMDRYEAERLLEGKPEGTFLLRDSAQDEYLFSVTFRKYGRSLHARIEQFNHKFSFDCHDPGVFTATTVTGLLEHYKDPSCVMFFEPMLTIPLHRNFTFSLQQLCRATIVSHITYDGINELHLPNSLKAYLKEYHYKLRVRVKPFDEPFYSCS